MKHISTNFPQLAAQNNSISAFNRTKRRTTLRNHCLKLSKQLSNIKKKLFANYLKFNLTAIGQETKKTGNKQQQEEYLHLLQ